MSGLALTTEVLQRFSVDKKKEVIIDGDSNVPITVNYELLNQLALKSTWLFDENAYNVNYGKDAHRDDAIKKLSKYTFRYARSTNYFSNNVRSC